ncbi:PIR protein [Plasmodium vivax]|uniref:VIR protein n=1 Tax=Plasmodium vivax TaxID=5855 RepID=A0A564ZWF8_PLAVI|nr:PIR protein [Plasmodium vivax]VUZ96170.1 PIR protein [Plasmodium vivax]
MVRELYNKYYDLRDNPKIDCSTFLEYCKHKYTEAWNNCFHGDNADVCYQLNSFRIDYEKNRTSHLAPCPHITLPELPEFKLDPSSNKNGLINDKIGKQLVDEPPETNTLGLTKITTYKYKELRSLILLKYNIPLVYTEDEKRSAMMNILLSFIRYCKENNGHANLILFMNEFLEYYYIKQVNEYEKIYTDCTSNKYAKYYCTLFTICSEDFKKEFSELKKNADKYIKGNKGSIVWSSRENTSMENLISIFRNNPYILHILPAIVALILFSILFYSYKCTDVRYWLRKNILKRTKKNFNIDEEDVVDSTNNNFDSSNFNSKKRIVRLSY